MKVRLKDKPEVTGWSGQFNVHAVSPQEIIVGFDDGDMSSDYSRDYEVLLDEDKPTVRWRSFRDAFAAHDLIIDNHNTVFFEPTNVEDRTRGFTL